MLILLLSPAALLAQVHVDTVIRFPSPTYLSRSCYVSELNKLYVYTHNYRIDVLECSSYTVVAEIPWIHDGGGGSFVWDAHDQKLYFNDNSGLAESLMVIDAIADTVLGWLPYNSGACPAYSAELNLLFLGRESLLIFDCATDSIIRRIASPNGYGFAEASWDSVSRRVYLAQGIYSVPGMYAVYDYVADSFVAVVNVDSVTRTPGYMYFDNDCGKGYFTADAPPPFDGFAGAIDTRTLTFQALYRVRMGLGHKGPIAVNKRDHKAYLAGSVGGSQTRETLWVVDCVTDSVVKRIEYMRGWGAEWARWVPWSNRLYLSSFISNCIVVLDCNTDSIIIPRLELGSSGPVQIQLDPVHERIFATGVDSNLIYVLRDVGYGIAEPPASSPRPTPTASLRESPAGVELSYSVASPCRVQVSVYDLLGRNVKALVAETQSAGLHRAIWNRTASHGARVSRGVYYISVTMGATRVCLKAVVR